MSTFSLIRESTGGATIVQDGLERFFGGNTSPGFTVKGNTIVLEIGRYTYKISTTDTISIDSGSGPASFSGTISQLKAAIKPVFPKANTGSSGSGNDADAQTFFISLEANAIELDSTQKGAVIQLVKDFKSAGVWAKMLAIYPFIAGLPSSFKFNLKDPRDLDAAYRLTFVGSPTYSGNGVTWNGATQYADTHLVASAVLGQNNKHISYYNRSIGQTACLMGAGSASSADGLFPNYANGGENYSALSCSTNLKTGGVSQGFHLVSRLSPASFSYYRNGGNSVTENTVSDLNPAVSFTIGARNTPTGTQQHTPTNCAFATIGNGLTALEVAAMYTAVQAYQTTLNRNV